MKNITKKNMMRTRVGIEVDYNEKECKTYTTVITNTCNIVFTDILRLQNIIEKRL